MPSLPVTGGADRRQRYDLRVHCRRLDRSPTAMAQTHNSDGCHIITRAQPDAGGQNIADLCLGIDPARRTFAVPETAMIEIQRVVTRRCQVTYKWRHVGFLATGVTMHTDDRRTFTPTCGRGEGSRQTQSIRIKGRRFAGHAHCPLPVD